MKVAITSFGYKTSGPPENADLVSDVRAIPNPYHIPGMMYRTGLDQEIHKQVFHDPEIPEQLLYEAKSSILEALGAGKKTFYVAFGCTAGKHRSVALAEELRRRVKNLDGVSEVYVQHTDLIRAFTAYKEIKALEKQLDKANDRIKRQEHAMNMMRERLNELKN